MTDPNAVRPFYESWQFWWQMLMLVGIVVNGIYSWWVSREKVTGRRFAALEKEVSKRVTETALKESDTVREKRCLDHLKKTHTLELSVKGIEVGIENMPGQKSVNELHGRVTDLAKEVSKMDGSLKGLSNQVNLIHEYIIKE
jgi:uncharacterized phage infection (PIP) family protein YhgE